MFSVGLPVFKENTMVECPVCSASVQLGEDCVVGELLSCPECGTELEITSLNPPAVAEAPQEEEDWGE
jgi:alpha-aminoadipate carrier protein LysW